MEEKKPLETKIPKNTEVEPSIEIQIQMQKKILDLIWHWNVTAPPMFPPVREFIFIPNVHTSAYPLWAAAAVVMPFLLECK